MGKERKKKDEETTVIDCDRCGADGAYPVETTKKGEHVYLCFYCDQIADW